VFARDFEGLGPGLLDDTRGLKVTRLQALLTRTGLYDGGETGVLGPTTRSAVMAFQRSRYSSRTVRWTPHAHGAVCRGRRLRSANAGPRRVVSSILDALAKIERPAA
jgi:hypothetical protein